jgi:hypothetical protein
MMLTDETLDALRAENTRLNAELEKARERVARLVNLSALQTFERGDYAETQYYTGIDVGMSVAYTRAEDEALVNTLRDTFARLVAEREALRSRLNDALAWLGMNRTDLHPFAAADLHGILTGQVVGDLIERN